MNPTYWTAVATVLVGVYSGTVAMTQALTARKNFERELARDLRAERLAVYAELWRLVAPLYADPIPETWNDDRVSLVQALHKWYGEDGNGLLMSLASWIQFHWLEEMLDNMGMPRNSCVEQASQLRTQLAIDVGTRGAVLGNYTDGTLKKLREGRGDAKFIGRQGSITGPDHPWNRLPPIRTRVGRRRISIHAD